MVSTRRISQKIEEMTPYELNKCLQKFYLSARKQDGTFYNKKSLTAWRVGFENFLPFVGILSGVK